MQSKFRHFSKKLFLINANWTAVEAIQGWKHYRICARRRDDREKLELEMMAVCDREIRFWVERSVLRDPKLWSPGWKD
jgi:tryptophan-rich hypothetical protein